MGEYIQPLKINVPMRLSIFLFDHDGGGVAGVTGGLDQGLLRQVIHLSFSFGFFLWSKSVRKPVYQSRSFYKGNAMHNESGPSHVSIISAEHIDAPSQQLC